MVNVYIITIDYNKRVVFGSIKRSEATQEQLAALKLMDSSILCEIVEVDNRTGLTVINKSQDFKGVIPIGEICWGYPHPLNVNFYKGDSVNVKLVRFKPENNIHICSIKKTHYHKFEKVRSLLKIGSEIKGQVLKSHNTFSIVSFELNNAKFTGFIRNDKVSLVTKIHKGDLANYLIEGECYTFIIDNIFEQNSSISLDRISYLESFESPQIGDAFDVTITKIYKNKVWFYSDDLEGYAEKTKGISIGDKVSVIPVSSDSNEYEIIS